MILKLRWRLRRYLIVVFFVMVFGEAYAAPVTYEFTGTVLQVGSQTVDPPAINQKIAISITVEQMYPASPSDPNSYDSGYSFNPESEFNDLMLVSVFNGQISDGSFDSITINPGSDINFFTTSSHLGFGYNLTLSGALPNALSGTQLPFSLDPSLFTAGVFSVRIAFDATVYGFSGTIDGLGRIPGNEIDVPEPKSWMLLGIGLLAMLGACRKRRQDETLQRR